MSIKSKNALLKQKQKESDEIIDFAIGYFKNLESGKPYKSPLSLNSTTSDNLMKGGGVMGTMESFNKNVNMTQNSIGNMVGGGQMIGTQSSLLSNIEMVGGGQMIGTQSSLLSNIEMVGGGKMNATQSSLLS